MTQDLLTIQWTLQAAGYAIGSTWHNRGTSTRLLPFEPHGNPQQAPWQACDSLVVICGRREQAARELALMAGLALARGWRVIWVGAPVSILHRFSAVEQFATAEDFRQHILHQIDHEAEWLSLVYKESLKPVAISSLFFVIITVVVCFAYIQLSVDNHPSTPSFVSKTNQ